MMGFDAPYVPGWDCHGLPIEQKVDKKLGSKKKDMSAVEIRRACRAYARGVHRHPARGVPAPGRRRAVGPAIHDDGLPVRGRDRPRLRRLLREEPRLPGPEVGALVLHGPHRARRGGARVRGAAGSGDLRRVPDATSGSPSRGTSRPRFSIWTTTPWTIPSNLAIAVHPDETYVWCGGRRRSALRRRREASRRASPEALGWTNWKPGPVVPGRRPRRAPSTRIRSRPSARGELTRRGRRASRSASFSADYVTMDTGTGLVHTAPGHGEDDFLDGQREKPPDPLAGRRSGPLHDGREVPRARRCSTRTPRSSRTSRPPAPSSRVRPEVPPRVPALLALQEPGHLSRDDPVVRASRRPEDRRPARRARRDRPRDVDPRLGRGAHRRHGREPPRVGRLPPAALGLADHAPLRDARRRSAPASIRGATRPPRSSTVSSPTSPASFARRGATPGTRAPPRTSCPPGADLRGFARDDFQAETDILDVWFDSGVSHIAVLRSGAWPELDRAGRPGRTARPTSTSRGTTSTAAGSSRRF